jgi:hypothetical protein
MSPVTEIRCSQLARPMVCPGFLSFKDLPVSPENDAAKEGTAAGEFLAWKLTKPDMETPKQASNGVYFDDDMRFYTKPIVEEINSNRQTEVLCEQRIDWQTRSGIWIRGSYDISFIREGRLYIDDLKYGWGIVEVKENWQLLGYAIGEVLRRGMAFEKIILRIHQPRPHHEDGSTRVWELTYPELLSYKERIEQRMMEIARGDRTLNTGKQCKYCQAAPEACPAFNRLFYRALEVSTEFMQDSIDEPTLARQLEHAQRAQEVIKIKMSSLEELAISRIKSGKLIPGYTTSTRYGDRKWKDGISPDVIKTMTGIDLVEHSMMSPAKAEKLGINKKFVNALVDRQFLGQKLVRDSGQDGDKIFGKGQPTMEGSSVRNA